MPYTKLTILHTLLRFKMWVFVLFIIPQCSSSEILNQVSQIINTFSPCYTDVIFSKTVTDIQPPDYPILISTPQGNFSVTPSTIRENEFILIDDDPAPHSVLPTFEGKTGSLPHPIKVRLNCVALILLDAQSKADAVRCIRNRHNWVHPTHFKYRYRREPWLTDRGVYYSGNVYINLLSETGFESAALSESLWHSQHCNSNKVCYSPLPLYFWRLGGNDNHNHELSEAELRIFINPVCGLVFAGYIGIRGLSHSF